MLSRCVLVIGLVLCFLLPACSLFGTDDDTRDRLETYRDEWEARDLSNYQFELHRTCFCPHWLYPAVIEVRDDTVTAVLDPETNDPLQSPHNGAQAMETALNAYLTVDELFNVIERANEEDYHRLSVEYNDQLGYPKNIELEVGKDVVDDRKTYVVEEFEVQ